MNEVISQCKATNLGAMPMGVTATSMAFDFRELASDANRLSLVRSTMSTYIDCAELADNTAQASATASGHMRPTPGTTGSLVSILAEDAAAAADAMREGVYDVCFYRASASTWTNMGIGLVVQNQLLGLEVLGLSHGSGTRLAVPLDTLHPIVIRPNLPDGTMPAENDRITVIAVNEDCAAAPALVPFVPDEERPAASGYLNFSIDSAQFVGGHVLATLRSRWYQVCFSKAGGPFSKTGIGLFVQHDVSAVTVNGVTPNRGADVSVPPVRASEILLHRVVPRLGYHQVLQVNQPLALFSFEDAIPSQMFDNHCGQSCSSSDMFLPGSIENGQRGSVYQPGDGTYKYLMANGQDTHAYTLAEMVSPGMAVSVIFALHWMHDESWEQNPSLQILAPFRTDLDSFPEGFISLSLKVDPSIDNTGLVVRQRQLELKLKGFQDTTQEFNGADTVLFNHLFDEEVWYFVALTIDMGIDGIARLFVNGQPEDTPTVNRFERFGALNSASFLRMGPCSIGAWHDGSNLRDVFYGFLDEVCAAACVNVLDDHQICLNVSILMVSRICCRWPFSTGLSARQKSRSNTKPRMYCLP